MTDYGCNHGSWCKMSSRKREEKKQRLIGHSGLYVKDFPNLGLLCLVPFHHAIILGAGLMKTELQHHSFGFPYKFITLEFGLRDQQL